MIRALLAIALQIQAAQTRLSDRQIGCSVGTCATLSQALRLTKQIPTYCDLSVWEFMVCAEPLSTTDCIDSGVRDHLPVMVCTPGAAK